MRRKEGGKEGRRRWKGDVRRRKKQGKERR